MYTMNTSYTIVTTAQHQEDIRRAAEFRMVRDAGSRTGARGFAARIYSRFVNGTEAAAECACERKPQAIS